MVTEVVKGGGGFPGGGILLPGGRDDGVAARYWH